MSVSLERARTHVHLSIFAFVAIALREAVANLYNQQYRQDKISQYTYENVCIVPGGRAGLSRVAAVIGEVYCVSTALSVAHASITDPGTATNEVVPSARLHRI